MEGIAELTCVVPFEIKSGTVMRSNRRATSNVKEEEEEEEIGEEVLNANDQPRRSSRASGSRPQAYVEHDEVSVTFFLASLNFTM